MKVIFIKIFVLFSMTLPINVLAKTNDRKHTVGLNDGSVIHVSEVNCKSKFFKHNIQLQLFDSFGLPVPGTEFWVTLDIQREGSKVTIQLPVINFQTGPMSTHDPVVPLVVPGGYLYTADGFLPEDARPNDLVYRSILAASNDGQSLPFSYKQAPTSLPTPPAGYIVSITNAGGIVVQCAGTFANIIPAGPHILMPSDITYFVKPKQTLSKNFVIDKGFTNTTGFTGTQALTQLRDSHVNDAFDNVAAWAWTSNANIADQTNGTLNVFVALGEIKNDGSLKIKKPLQLTNLPAGEFAWDTAVAINRTDKKNIVVSWSHLNAPGTTYRAVTFDGGKTWPINGPTNIQPTGTPSGAGDNRGVSSDKFGNIWYSTTNFFDDSGNIINQVTYWMSKDGGRNFSVAFTTPLPSVALGEMYDFPQYCFGGDEFGNYGLWFVADFVSSNTQSPAFTGNTFPVFGFIPITGLGTIGTPSFVKKENFLNVNNIQCITASSDGRVWTFGYPTGPIPTVMAGPGSGITAVRVSFKSPGPIDQNYAGPWDFAIVNLLSATAPFFSPISQPYFGYFNSAQTNIYDDKRKALYQVTIGNFPDFSQNMRLYFSISRDNGQTWSDPIDISNTDVGNRGFQSMALDPVTGNLVFGWYDGRNDSTFKSVQYFGAVIPAKELDKLVENIPLSNPLYSIPSSVSAQRVIENSAFNKERLINKWGNRLIKKK